MAVDQVTYRRLDGALQSLGFHRHTVNGSVTYDRSDSGALVSLPALPLDETVLPRHLAAARAGVAGIGVAGEPEFERALAGAGAGTTPVPN